MATYVITIVEDYPLDRRTLAGIGTIEKGEPLERELSDEQIRSLRGRGIEVHLKPARSWKAKTVQTHIEPADESAHLED